MLRATSISKGNKVNPQAIYKIVVVGLIGLGAGCLAIIGFVGGDQRELTQILTGLVGVLGGFLGSSAMHQVQVKEPDKPKIP